jgi:hypothetical protein
MMIDHWSVCYGLFSETELSCFLTTQQMWKRIDTPHGKDVAMHHESAGTSEQGSPESDKKIESQDDLLPPSEETDFFLTFSPPTNPTPDERRLVADIVVLDHRAHHQLRPKTREWDEVLKLLINVSYFCISGTRNKGVSF